MLSKLLVKSNAKVDVLPSDSLYCVFKFARTCGGNAPPVNVTVLPDEDPEKFAENEKMHTLVSSLMKDILKIKNYKQKLKLKLNE
jgi:hypothetical protein